MDIRSPISRVPTSFIPAAWMSRVRCPCSSTRSTAASILSAAMLLKYSLNRIADADRIEAAVLNVLGQGYRTRDIHSAGTKLVGTVEMGDLIAREVERAY